MLILTRVPGDPIKSKTTCFCECGRQTEVIVLDGYNGARQVRIGFVAPHDVDIQRNELLQPDSFG